MSEQTDKKATPEGAPHPKHRIRKFILWTLGSLLVLLIILVAGVSWYTTTADFQRRVGTEVVSVLEDATGGRVELGRIKFSLWRLAIEADNLVIHGTEGPGEAPYLSADKIFVRVKINTFLSHTVGKGAQSHIGVNFLRVEQPHVHLIIDKNGATNQPVPKHPSTSTEPVQNTLLDLQAGKVELANGLILINDRPIPFDAAANDLNAEVHYITSSDHYGATIDLADLRTKMAKNPEVQSKLHLAAELGRDMFALQSFDFDSGAATHLSAQALVEHFSKPEWQADVDGGIDLKQLGLLAGLEGFTGGAVNLDVHGRNCTVAPDVAQKNPHFWQRRNRNHAPAEAKMLTPSPDCKAGYLLVGNVKLNDAGFQTEDVRLHNVNASSQLTVTPTELLFSALTGHLPGGGTIAGDLKIENWLGEVPADTPAQSPTTVAAAQTANKTAVAAGAKPPVDNVNISHVERAHAYATVTVNKITLRTILEITAPQKMGDLGLDTQISGPVKAEWGGPASDIASSVHVTADLQLSPSGMKRVGAGTNVPVSGVVQAAYDGKTQVVNIQRVDIHTPATNLAVNGVLGVNNGDPLTNLQVNLQARDLGEFDQTLQTIGFESNGRKGSAALPVVLHGTLGFVGTARGAIRNIDVKGHLNADNLEAKLGTSADVHIDSVLADAEYSPSNGIAVASSTIKRNSAVLNLAGTFVPHRVVRRHVVSYEWDNDTAVKADVKLANAQMPDLLQIAGQADKVQITGTANMNAHVVGTLGNLNGTGSLALTNGTAYGEQYQNVAADLSVRGQQITATRLLLQAHNMSITGDGAYNLASKHIQANIQGNNIQLSKLDTIQKANLPADGVLSLKASANGTIQEPNLNAQLTLANIVYEGQNIGQVDATAHSTGSTVYYDLHSTLVGAQVAADGQTSLVGDYQTNAKLTLSGLDIAKPMTMFSPDNTMKASSQIDGTVTVSGPAAKPMQLVGNADFSNFAVTVQGVQLKAVEPIRASLRNGIATLDSLHIAGPDTDIRGGGTATVFGDANPQGGPINLNATGSLNLALLHTFDKDVTASGKIEFKVGAEGRLKQPLLNGNVDFERANLAMNGIANGLSDLNGTMVFNQNRLEVKNLVGTSGGGKITLGGFVAYQKGLFANITANVDNVRVRLNGLSTTANAALTIQGGPQSLLLSGNVLITRFSVGKDVDFAAFAGAGGVTVPPDPDAFTNKIRMDVRVASSPQLDFQNSYAKLAGTVDLTVRGTVAQPSILGTIRITDGSATFAGTKYQVDRGVIYFSNPVRIDPQIDLDVSTHVSTYDITVGLHGSVSNLKPTYRSEPPLTEADIFNVLALGRTAEQAQISSQQQTQAGTDPTTSAVLGGALNAAVGSRAGKLFGPGSIKIDPSYVGSIGGSSARITLTEPISKQITLVFATNVNQSSQQLIQVQYQLNDNTSLVATRDENGVFSIVYKIRQRYR